MLQAGSCSSSYSCCACAWRAMGTSAYHPWQQRPTNLMEFAGNLGEVLRGVGSSAVWAATPGFLVLVLAISAFLTLAFWNLAVLSSSGRLPTFPTTFTLAFRFGRRGSVLGPMGLSYLVPVHPKPASSQSSSLRTGGTGSCGCRYLP